MASQNGDEDRRLKTLAALREAPERFDFYQAMRRIEGAHPHLPRVGEARRPQAEAVRLAQDPMLDFAGSNLTRVTITRAGKTRLFSRFLGLFGPNGALPLHLTEYVRERERSRNDPTAARFVDLFHHRLLSLFYRAWRQAQPTASRDHPAQDRFRLYGAALIGFGMPTQEQGSHPDAGDGLQHADERRFFAGLLSRASRNAEGLEALLSAQLALPVRVRCHVRRWLALPLSQRTRLGGRGAVLGQSAVIGSRVPDVQSQIEVVVGPMSLVRYQELLPGQPMYRAVRRWMLTYTGDEYNARMRLVLAADEVPRTVLAQAGRLGLDTWLGRRPAALPAAQLSLAISSICREA